MNDNPPSTVGRWLGKTPNVMNVKGVDYCQDCGCEDDAHITEKAARVAGARLCLAHPKCKGFKPYPRNSKGHVYEP